MNIEDCSSCCMTCLWYAHEHENDIYNSNTASQPLCVGYCFRLKEMKDCDYCCAEYITVPNKIRK